MFLLIRCAKRSLSLRNCGNLLQSLCLKKKHSTYSFSLLVSTYAYYFCSVDICLKMCGLEAYADAAVGSLDIEHRKRTTIAVELAAKVCI